MALTYPDFSEERRDAWLRWSRRLGQAMIDYSMQRFA
jgi:hypothetical protein